MSINKKTVDTAIFECERFLERARLVAALGYEYAGVTYTAAVNYPCLKAGVSAPIFDEKDYRVCYSCFCPCFRHLSSYLY